MENPGSDMKTAVHDFWNAAPCGLVYASGADLKSQLRAHAEVRYALEPYIATFSQFQELDRGPDVLEIGVGMGGDHLEWAKVRPESLSGVDLTEAAIEHTSNRLAFEGATAPGWIYEFHHQATIGPRRPSGRCCWANVTGGRCSRWCRQYGPGRPSPMGPAFGTRFTDHRPKVIS